MGEMIGTLDVKTLHAELELGDLKPLAWAYWLMTAYSVHPSQFAKRFGEQSGTVQVLFPGPVVMYENVGGHYNVQIFQNGETRKQTEQLHHHLADYAQRSSGK